MTRAQDSGGVRLLTVSGGEPPHRNTTLVRLHDLQHEWGLTRADSESVMRAVGWKTKPGRRSWYCRRLDVDAYLETRRG